MTSLILRSTLSSLALLTALSTGAHGQDTEPTPQDVAQQKLNPLAYGITLPAQWSFGLLAHGEVQPTLNFQPVIPFKLSDDWRIVTRSNASIVHNPEPDAVTGLGDSNISLFLTPAQTGSWVWGVGPIVQFPTATNSALGTGKWCAGPTGALVYASGPWVNGVLVSQLWSFAGPSSRQAVSLMQIEWQVSYTFPDGWYLQSAPTISYDWRAPSGQGWTVPVGVDGGKAFKIGSQNMSAQIGVYYNVKKPTGTAGWSLQTQLSWMY